MSTKKATSFRLSQEALEILKKLAAQNSVAQSAIVELALRHFDASRKSTRITKTALKPAPKTGRAVYIGNEDAQHAKE